MNLGQLTSLIHCKNCGLPMEIYPSQDSIKCTVCGADNDLKMKNLFTEDKPEEKGFENTYNIKLEDVHDNDICINYASEDCCRYCDNMYNPKCHLYESNNTRRSILDSLYKNINTEN